MDKCSLALLAMLALNVNAGVNDSKSTNFRQWGSPYLQSGRTCFYKSGGYKITAHYKKGRAIWVTYEKKGLKAKTILDKLSRLGKWVPTERDTYVIYNTRMGVTYRGTYYKGSFTIVFQGGRRY
jgi:hypothetical protein